MKLNLNGFGAGMLVGLLVATVGFAVLTRNQQEANKVVAQKKQVLKLAHSLDPSHPVHMGMEFMKTKLEEFSGGTMSIDIYPSGVLGSETECIEQLQNGVLAMTKTSAAPMEGFIPEMGVFSLPYVFRDRDHFWQTLDSELGQSLLIKGIDKNLRGLTYYDAGSRNFYTKTKPILSPEDLKGLKIRVMNSKTAMAMISALGGAPTPISWGELYTSLQQGVVDGAENNPPSYYSNRHHEVAGHFSLDGHTRIPDILLISTKIWDKLNVQQQRWVQKAAHQSSLYQRNLWHQKTQEALAKAQEEGVKVYKPDQRAFVEKVQPLITSYKGSPAGKLYDEIQKF